MENAPGFTKAQLFHLVVRTVLAVKLYIAVDTEGEACITRESSATAAYGTFQAEYLRTVATREAAAAVEGAREAGADDIVVHDSGFIRGVTPIGMVLLYDELPRGIRIAWAARS